MSNNAPILPPGSPLQRAHPERNSRLFVAVFAVLAVHVLLLAGLLIQGCKRQDQNAGATGGPATAMEEAPQPAAVSNVAPEPEPKVGSVTPPSPAAVQTNAAATTSVEPVTRVLTAPAVTEKTLTSNLTAAAASSGAPTVSQSTTATAASPQITQGEAAVTVYAVKQGDTLTKIAKAHNTTLSAIRALNGLKTDRILVGQKIKVPATAK
jgi:LysM repeat protein